MGAKATGLIKRFAMEKLWTEFCAKWGLGTAEKKRLPLLLAALVLGLTLLAAANGLKTPAAGSVYSENAPPAQDEAYSDGQLPETELAAVLSHIQGAGKVLVKVTYAAGEYTEYAVNSSTTSRTVSDIDENGSNTTAEQTTADTLVLVDGNSKPVVVHSTMPPVQGVLVVAEGGNNPAVCQSLTAALQSLLGVGAHKIVICPYEP